MKRNIHILAMALMALCSLALTSCDDDNDIEVATNLNGVWRGAISTSYYSDNYYQYYGDLQYNEWATEFRFYSYDGSYGTSTSGEGVEVDYDTDYYNQYYKVYYFKWNVAYGNIYLYFENGENLVIRNYRMTSSHLQGDLETSDGVYVATINLRSTNDWFWDTSYAKGTRATQDSTVNNKRIFNK